MPEFPISKRNDFYPRPPRGGRPAAVCRLCMRFVISIHALREEGDFTTSYSAARGALFLSTPSARRATFVRAGEVQFFLEFLSTPSARRATLLGGKLFWMASYFYPRPPRGGRPSWAASPRTTSPHFYPRPPRGGRRRLPRGKHPGDPISIHALREEGDHGRRVRRHRYGNFYPRPPRGGRPRWSASSATGSDFYPRPPRGGRHYAKDIRSVL